MAASSKDSETRVEDSLGAHVHAAQVNCVGLGGFDFLQTGGAEVGSGQWLGGGSLGPCNVNGLVSHAKDLDSEETISDYTNTQDNFIHRRGRKKNNNRGKAALVGVPICFQFAKAIKDGKGGVKRKGGLGATSSKILEQSMERGDKVVEESLGALNVGGGGPGTSASGLRLILEESGALESETPLIALSGTCRKELDASRIFSLQKYNGINFEVVDKTTVSKLTELEDIEVSRTS